MKKFLFTTATALVMSGLAIGGYAYHQQSQINPAILENIDALSGDEGTSVGSCARRSGPLGSYDSRYFCDSKTNSTTIYSCPTSVSSDYYIASNMDRCTK